MASRLPVIGIALLVGTITAVSSASGTSLLYLSQTGSVSAQGYTDTLGSSSQSFPISGLSDVDQVAEVEDGVPPDAYQARAELHTRLGATQLQISGDASGDCAYDDSNPTCGVYSQGLVSIAFDLASASVLSIDYSYRGNNGATITLRHLDIGFSIEFTDGAVLSATWECGDLPEAQCFYLLDILNPQGTYLPGGSYELTYHIYAFDPQFNSCVWGCSVTGGDVVLNVIPEPVSGALLGAGLFSMGLRRRSARSRRRGLPAGF